MNGLNNIEERRSISKLIRRGRMMKGFVQTSRKTNTKRQRSYFQFFRNGG